VRLTDPTRQIAKERDQQGTRTHRRSFSTHDGLTAILSARSHLEHGTRSYELIDSEQVVLAERSLLAVKFEARRTGARRL
jgi:hypothetical protein